MNFCEIKLGATFTKVVFSPSSLQVFSLSSLFSKIQLHFELFMYKMQCLLNQFQLIFNVRRSLPNIEHY